MPEYSFEEIAPGILVVAYPFRAGAVVSASSCPPAWWRASTSASWYGRSARSGGVHTKPAMTADSARTDVRSKIIEARHMTTIPRLCLKST